MEPREHAPSSDNVAVVASTNGTAVAAARQSAQKRQIGAVKTEETHRTEGDGATRRMQVRVSPSTRLAAERWIDESGGFSSEAVARARNATHMTTARGTHLWHSYRCRCGHELNVFGGGRHRCFFELEDRALKDPVMSRACPACRRQLPGKNPPLTTTTKGVVGHRLAA